MRYLILFVLTVSAFAQTAVDGYVNLNLASPAAPGTALTSTIMNNGSTGAISGWALTGTTSAMSVGTHNPNCTLTKPITTSGVTYGVGSTSQSFSMSMVANTAATGSVSGTGRVTVLSTCWKAPSGTPTNVEDVWSFELSTMGFEMWVQWVPSNCLRIESAKDGFATSGCIILVPGNTYQVVILDDYLNGVSKLAVFNPFPPFAQVGTTQQMNEFVNAGHTSRISFGNQQIGTSATTQQMENILLDNTSGGATFPTLGVGSTVGAPLWQGIISPTRAVDWSNPGVTGGIPVRNTICSTFTSAATATQINNAIAACPSGQVVFLAAGTYSLTSTLQFSGISGVTLRGAGADQTILITSGATACGTGSNAGICIRAIDSNFKTSPTNTANWTAGYNKGATSITISSKTNLAVGHDLILDQLDDTTNGCDVGGVLISDITTTCTSGSPTSPGINGPYSGQGNGGGAQRPGPRMQEQIVKVTSISGGACPCTIGISPGLYMPNWRASQTPQAWWATSPSQFDGVENLTIDSTNNGTNSIGIGFYNATDSWVSGVRSIDTARAHEQIFYSPRITIRDSYDYLTQNNSSSSYGVEVFDSSDCLIENNIFQAIVSPYMFNGPASGCVADYNFSTLYFYTDSTLYNATSHNDHTAGVDSGLLEGNVGNAVNADVIHGTHNFGTLFRDRWSGPALVAWQSSTNSATSVTKLATGTFAPPNNNLSPVVLNSFTRFDNVIGNVLGTTGTNTGYLTGTFPVLDLGGGNPGFSPPVPNDANVQPTTMIWGNADSATGFASPRFNCSEVPTGLTNQFQQFFSNPCPSTTTLPPSFVYAAKPSWWPAAKAWPPIGPDVTGGNISGTGGRAYTIPAQDCYLNVMAGPANGVSSVLTFNAANCYGTPANPNPPPTAPATAIQAKFTKLLNPFLEAR